MNVRAQLTLRRKLYVYLVIIHLLFAGVTVYFLWGNRIWLLAVEVVFIGSLVVGISYIRALFVPIELIRTGTELIDDQSFTTRFVEIGQIEMDQLIRVYNRMADHLRTERIRLREQHYFLEKILNNSPAGILIFDFDDRIEVVNPSAESILRVTADRLIGRSLSALNGLLPDALTELSVGASRVIPLRGQRRVKCYRAQFLDQGFPRTFIMMEELTEELRRTEKAAYEKLIRTTAHEVNNTVGAVNSLLQSCLQYRNQIRNADRDDYRTALQVARVRNNHLNEFIRNYAEVVKLPPPVKRPCDVQALIENIAYLMNAESRERDIVWRWAVDSALPPVSLDKSQMEQVFVNILKNALEAIGEHGAVTIRLGQEDGRPYAMIEDTGPGIPPEIQAGLFTPFFSTKENGQGIGLTLVQEILTQHRFEFTLESRPDEPTRFTVYFA